MVLVLVTVFSNLQLQAQNIAVTDDNGYAADGSAMLDVKSTTKGLLIPRMDASQRSTISTPATGLLVFDTDDNTFYYYNGDDWISLSSHIINSDVTGTSTALFSVVNNNTPPDTVFAVYPEGVVINVGDGDAKGNRGGFAVGGLSSGGKSGERYFRVFRDSVRVNINENAKANRGGFAVGGLSGKASNEFMKITQDNYFIGHQSGEDFYSGVGRNCVMGYQSGQDLYSGYDNVFMGYQAGNKNYSGYKNVFIGYQSGETNYNGRDNTFVGTETGFANVDGDFNTFLGYQSGTNNSKGDYNTFVGHQAGYSNHGDSTSTLMGDYNTFIGYYSGRDNTTGYRNTFVGYYSGYRNSSGIGNVFYGGFAGAANRTADNNTYVGYTCGRYATGSGNSFFGYNAGLGVEGSSSGTLNTFIGHYAGEDFTEGSSNVALGYNAGRSVTSGDYNLFLGRNAGYGVTTDSYKLYIQGTSSISTPQTPLIYGDFSSDYVVIDGLNNNSKTFYVNGSAGGTGSWNAKTDEKQKSNTKEIENALAKVRSLVGVSFDYTEEKDNITVKRIGVTPVQLQKTLPEVITKHEDGSYSIQYAPITAVLIEAIKEQQAIIEKQNARIEALEKKLE
jgi:hypothetical protein